MDGEIFFVGGESGAPPSILLEEEVSTPRCNEDYV